MAPTKKPAAKKLAAKKPKATSKPKAAGKQTSTRKPTSTAKAKKTAKSSGPRQWVGWMESRPCQVIRLVWCLKLFFRGNVNFPHYISWDSSMGPFLNHYALLADYPVHPERNFNMAFNISSFTGRELKSLGLTFENIILENLQGYNSSPMVAFAWVMIKR